MSRRAAEHTERMVNSTSSTLIVQIERFAQALIRHWLLLFNSVAVLYAALPWIAPLLERAGWLRTGHLIFKFYGAWCHQLPDRSFFIGGYQVCYCHRCTALYTSIALTGLIFGALRWRFMIPNRMMLLATLPILIDGLWHMADDFLPNLGLRSSVNDVGSLNFWLRMITGVLFGTVLIIWIYPRFDAALKDAMLTPVSAS